MSMNLRKRWAGLITASMLLGIGLALATPSTAQAQVVTSKRCSRCSASLPLTAGVGSTCPSCGAYFSGTQYEYSAGGADAGTPQSSLQELFWQALLQKQQWDQQQRALEQQARATRAAELRDKIVAEREELYERVREKTEEFRQQDDPQRRAVRYLESAARCEAEGDRRAAVAYYRLAKRIVPNSDPGRQAAFEMARLQVQ